MILAAGLSPAWQQIYRLRSLSLGEVNRAGETAACASGKVLNVAVAAAALGVESLAVAPLGGTAGDAIAREFETLGLRGRWVCGWQPTRTCTTIIEDDAGRVTELVENAAAIDAAVCDAWMTAVCEELPGSRVVVLTGSLPPGAPESTYRDIISRSAAPVLLDARGPELLAALSAGPLLVKPNREELEQTFGKLAGAAALHGAMRELNQGGAEWVLVSNGPGEMWLSSREELFRFEPPALERVVNPIGCGDCLTAGIAAAVAEGRSVPEAVPYGVAAAQDNAGRLLPARIDRGEVDHRARGAVLERVATGVASPSKNRD